MARYNVELKRSAAKEVEAIADLADRRLVVQVVKVGDRRDVYR